MGTIIFGALDIGTLIVGGLIGKFLPKIVSGKPLLDGEERAIVLAKIDGLIDDLTTLRNAVAVA